MKDSSLSEIRGQINNGEKSSQFGCKQKGFRKKRGEAYRLPGLSIGLYRGKQWREGGRCQIGGKEKTVCRGKPAESEPMGRKDELRFQGGTGGRRDESKRGAGCCI